MPGVKTLIYSRGLVLAAAALLSTLPVAVAMPRAEECQILPRITDHRWQREIPPRGGGTPEFVTWEFYPNGMFRRQFLSDYSVSRTGAWQLLATSEESGVMFLATTSEPGSFDVLSLQGKGEQLRLGELDYRASPSAGAEPDIREQDRRAVDEQREQSFSSWIAMTASDWRSESGVSPGDPNDYSFARDGTYSAAFDVTACRFQGKWSSAFSDGGRSFVRVSVPANECDPRGPRDAFVREVPAGWDSGNLVLNERVYIPVTESR